MILLVRFCRRVVDVLHILGRMKDGGSKLALILGCVIAAAVVIVFVVGLLVVLYKYKKRIRRSRIPPYAVVSQTISSSVFNINS